MGRWAEQNRREAERKQRVERRLESIREECAESWAPGNVGMFVAGMCYVTGRTPDEIIRGVSTAQPHYDGFVANVALWEERAAEWIHGDRLKPEGV
jgi:hypothetical protein